MEPEGSNLGGTVYDEGLARRHDKISDEEPPERPVDKESHSKPQTDQSAADD